MKEKTPAEKAMDIILDDSHPAFKEFPKKEPKLITKKPRLSESELQRAAKVLGGVVVDGVVMPPEYEKKVKSTKTPDNKKKPVKASTIAKHKRMQARVIEMSKQFKYLSHFDICNRLATEFNCAPATIRRYTKKISN